MLSCRRKNDRRPASRPTSHEERPSMIVLKRTLLAGLAALAGVGAAHVAHAQEVTVKIGTVRSISTVSILWAAEKGYFKEFGIKVVNENLDTAANSIALLAQNQ